VVVRDVILSVAVADDRPFVLSGKAIPHAIGKDVWRLAYEIDVDGFVRVILDGLRHAHDPASIG
jgi:hypothetical protein